MGVHAGHDRLVLEIGAASDPAHHHLGALFFGQVNQKTREAHHPDVLERGHLALDHEHPPFGGEPGLLR